MENVSNTLRILLAAGFAASTPAQADSVVDAACQTTEFRPVWEDTNAELPYSAFRLEVLPDSARTPGNFVATIAKRSTATIELVRPTRACRWELTVDDCPAIADVANAVEQLSIPVGKGHAAELDRITLHGNTYRLQVRGNSGQRHSISYYSDYDNPILDLINDARESLLACVPKSLQDFVDPPSNH
ncbi:hypothetical protein [Denitratimonas tolerans]|uniref:Uncharacterized protein n=1 Tax=Denitratimonas tolerans TaxID=1338420 RepID=A0AAW9R809_9GAMM